MDGLGYPFCRKLIKSCELDVSYRPLSSVFGHLMLRNDKYYGRMKNDELTKIFLEFDFSSRDELLCLDQIIRRDSKKTDWESEIFEKLLNQINSLEANPNIPIGKNTPDGVTTINIYFSDGNFEKFELGCDFYRKNYPKIINFITEKSQNDDRDSLFCGPSIVGRFCQIS